MNAILHKYISEFGAGLHVIPEDAEAFFDELMAATDENLLDQLLRAWSLKGTSEGELYSMAKIMRERCIPVVSRHPVFVDVVGTGGSRSKRFNISTASAFVTAGAGVPVAKHGNRAATSNSGSADVLSELGVEPAVDAATAERCLNEIGICFMYAPNFHSLSPILGKVRRGLGHPTIFNSLGPLCNPAKARYQVIGVWNKDLVKKTANVLARLGTDRSWVVYGSDGIDELTLSGITYMAEVTDGGVSLSEISPEDFGTEIQPTGGAVCESPVESAALIRAILDGSSINRAAADLVKINSAAAIYITGRAASLTDAYQMAAQSLESGSALKKLEFLAAETNLQ